MGTKPIAQPFHVVSGGEEDTHRIAAIIASHLHIGDVLILTGDLACGKTYFVKGLAAALGSTDNVTSPTYALVHTYRTETGDLMHIDAYRLAGIDEFMDLGLEEYLAESVVAIEWGDKVAAAFDGYLSIGFHLADPDVNHRLLTFSCTGERWQSELAELKEALGGRNDESDTGH